MPDAADSIVVIDEVVSGGHVPDDWIELLNTANVPVNADGFVVRDNNVKSQFMIPATPSWASTARSGEQRQALWSDGENRGCAPRTDPGAQLACKVPPLALVVTVG